MDRQAIDVNEAKHVNAKANTTESFVALDLSALADSDMAMEMVA
jgi:hypothetical protein